MNFSGAREKESASAAQCLHSPSYSTTAGQVHDQSFDRFLVRRQIDGRTIAIIPPA